MATLTIKIAESTALNNYPKQSGLDIVKDIINVDNRVLTLQSGSIIPLITFSSSIGPESCPGTFITDDLEHLRISNTSSTGSIILNISSSLGEGYQIKLKSGGTFMLSDLTYNSGSVSSIAAFVTSEVPGFKNIEYYLATS